MKLDHDPGESSPVAHEGQIEEGEETEPALKRVNLTASPFSPLRFPQPRVKRRRTPRIIAMILLIPVAIHREPVSLYATQDDMQQAVSLLFKLISKHEIKDTGQKPAYVP